MNSVEIKGGGKTKGTEKVLIDSRIRRTMMVG